MLLDQVEHLFVQPLQFGGADLGIGMENTLQPREQVGWRKTVFFTLLSRPLEAVVPGTVERCENVEQSAHAVIEVELQKRNLIPRREHVHGPERRDRSQMLSDHLGGKFGWIDFGALAP